MRGSFGRVLLAVQAVVILLLLAISPSGFTAAPAAPAPLEQAAAKAVTIDFKDTDIRDVLRMLSTQQGVSILPDPGITGPVTIHLTAVPFEEGLGVLLDALGLTYTKQGTVYRVSRVKTQPYKVTWDKSAGRMSLSANNTDLGEIAREITAQTGTNVLLERSVKANITATLVDLPLEAILSALAEANGLRAVKRETHWAFTQPEAPAGPGVEQLQVDGELLSLRCRDVDLGMLLRELSAKAGLNLVAERDAKGTVSGSLVGVPLLPGLTTLLEANGFQLVNRGGTYVVRRSQVSTFAVVARPDGKFDLSVAGADLAQVLRDLADRAGVNLVVYSYVKAQVSQVAVEGVTLSEAFEYLLKGTPLVVQKRGQIYLVGDAGALRPDSADLVETRFYRLGYLAPEAVPSLLPPVFPASSLRPAKELSGVLATGAPEMLDRLQALLKLLDVPGKGASVETVRLTNTRADDLVAALGKVFPSQNFQPLRDNVGFLLTGTPEMVAQIKETIVRLDQPSSTASRLFILKHQRAEDLLRLLPPGMDRANVLPLPHLNALVAAGSEAFLTGLGNYLAQVDLPTPQILFDVLVVEYSRDSGVTSGLSLTGKQGQIALTLNEPDAKGNPSGLRLQVDSGKFAAPTFSAALNALVQEGKAKVLANPKLSALSGETASFNVVSRSYYWDPRFDDSDHQTTTTTTTTETGSGSGTTTTETLPTMRGGAPRSIDTGLKVKVKPWVSGAGEITVNIEPSISDSVGSQAELPKTNERSAQTTVRVKNGETIIIGGLIQSEAHRSSYQVPVLSALPVVGGLFKSKNNLDRQSEFVIYITPHLVAEAEAANKLFAPAWDAEEMQREGAAVNP